jgi:hypothetical protein
VIRGTPSHELALKDQSVNMTWHQYYGEFVGPFVSLAAFEKIAVKLGYELKYTEHLQVKLK